MRLNVAAVNTHRTYEGAPASRITLEQQLRRSVMSCMLWESEFYEDGIKIADRIKDLIGKVEAIKVFSIALEAKNKMKLRHIPLYIAVCMLDYPTHKSLVADLLSQIIQRPDELCEVLAMYWKDKRKPIAHQLQKGLARAFTKFNEYSLAKYNRDNAIKLKDVLFLCHAKPLNEAQAFLWKKLIAGELATPDTWEVTLSSGGDKKAHWERLISENKLGALAYLRNLRNMREAGVDLSLVRDGISKVKVDKVLPFRFISAARYAPQLEPQLEELMTKSIQGVEGLQGETLILVDVSGSMDSLVSAKSEVTRLDAACGLAIILRETSKFVRIATFSNMCVEVSPRRGFALRDAIICSQSHGGTDLGTAVIAINREKIDRLIVITDEQSHTTVPAPTAKKAYMINVASNRNGVGYGNGWNHIDGWSESVFDYIVEYEK